MNSLGDRNRRFSVTSWYFFDMGNSAHALLVSTVGFSIYFKSYLYAGDPKGDTAWAGITALILLVSATLSPVLTSALYRSSKRHIGLVATTLFCVLATLLLGTKLSDNVSYATVIYILSAIGYYLALPVYNSYLPNITESKLQKVSGIGWALGYLGGILSVSICFALGFLEEDVTKRPDIYRQIFVVAALFNLVLSVPMCVVSRRLDGTLPRQDMPRWSLREVFRIFGKYKRYYIIKLLLVYWLIGEVAVIVTYFFAIFLREYAGLDTKQIMTYFILGQIIAIATTWIAGAISEKIGGKKPLVITVLIWICIPLALFLISAGGSYWPAIVLISLVIGSYHAIIRGRIAHISNRLDLVTEKGSLFGFLEVSGRISQVIGPIFIVLCSLVLPLNYALLSAVVFPVLALILLKNLPMEE